MRCRCPEPDCPAPEYSPQGERHRIGPHEPRGLRRCLSEAEMLAKGWRLTPRGWDSSPPLTAGALAALGTKGAADAP